MQVEPGQTVRFQCNDCAIEWEVTLEPKVAEGASPDGLSAVEVERCPSCGNSDLEEC